MEPARRVIQIVRLALLACIVLYAIIVMLLPTSATPNMMIFKLATALALVLVATVFAFRHTMVQRALAALALHPEDRLAISRWRTAYLVVYLLSEAIATYGVILHFMGFSLEQVSLFFITGLLLILLYAPQRPAPVPAA